MTFFFQYIAGQLLKKNEQVLWCDPHPQDASSFAEQDDDVFLMARLIKLVEKILLSTISPH